MIKVMPHHRFLASVFVLMVFFTAPLVVYAQESLSQQRAMHEREVKAEKMKKHLQPTMREHGMDMWIIMSRENNPDAALDLFGAYGLTGWYGHRNAYIFYDPGEGKSLQSVVFGTHLSDYLKKFYDRVVSYHSGETGLKPLLREYVHEKDPQVIAINESRTISMADGLTAGLKKYLIDAIGPKYESRLTSSEPMFIDYVSKRTPAELEIEKEASSKTWNILRRAFSNEVITPGETELMDVYWWIVDEWKSQDVEFNFPPGLDIQRKGVEESIPASDNPVIQYGDIIHVDFGIKLMGLVTDQQKMAYVMRPGEEEPPEGLQKAFDNSERVGEFIVDVIEPGVLGYQIVKRGERRCQDEGITCSVYPHVQGNWVHGVGAWGSSINNERYGIHPKQPVRATEFWSIEYSATTPVPEWNGQEVTMAREEDAWVAKDGDVHYTTGPQENLWLIRAFGESGPASAPSSSGQ